MTPDFFLSLLERQGVGVTVSVLVVLAWVRGWFVSRRDHEAAMEVKDSIIADKDGQIDYWRRYSERVAGLAEGTLSVGREAVNLARTKRRP